MKERAVQRQNEKPSQNIVSAHIVYITPNIPLHQQTGVKSGEFVA
jgi:hypothetical protein